MDTLMPAASRVLRSAYSSMFTKREISMEIDLSTSPDAVIREILFRVDSRVLVKQCSLVSKQWNAILRDRHFWMEKSRIDGYPLPSLKVLMPLPQWSFQRIAILRPFERNLIMDEWNDGSFRPDRRWRFNKRYAERDFSASLKQSSFKVESPPLFLGGVHATENFDETHVEGCLATTYFWNLKRIVIDLWQEGLDKDVLDTLRPTIVVSELIAHRADCGAHYGMRCFLRATAKLDEFPEGYNVENRGTMFEKEFLFDQWQLEKWEKVEHEFRHYPNGMRYLILESRGKDRQFWAGHYGAKMAKCSVIVRCESNQNVAVAE